MPLTSHSLVSPSLLFSNVANVNRATAAEREEGRDAPPPPSQGVSRTVPKRSWVFFGGGAGSSSHVRHKDTRKLPAGAKGDAGSTCGDLTEVGAGTTRRMRRCATRVFGGFNFPGMRRGVAEGRDLGLAQAHKRRSYQNELNDGCDGARKKPW